MGRNSYKSGEPKRTRTSNRLIKSYVLKNQQNADFPYLPPFRLLQPLSGELLIGRDGDGAGVGLELESLQLDDYLPAHIVEFSLGVNSLPDNHVKNTPKKCMVTPGVTVLMSSDQSSAPSAPKGITDAP
jgi:hypothetical protein